VSIVLRLSWKATSLKPLSRDSTGAAFADWLPPIFLTSGWTKVAASLQVRVISWLFRDYIGLSTFTHNAVKYQSMVFQFLYEPPSRKIKVMDHSQFVCVVRHISSDSPSVPTVCKSA
jgi:hypothetical protein